MTKILCLFLGLLLLQTVSFANPQAMIILDASGSMWGQLEGRDKITLSKEALLDSGSSWNANVRLGLIAFGHRSSQTCSGSEIIVELGAPDESRALSKLQSLNPKSKGSIGHALRTAAEALDNTNEKATVILISDGQDACLSRPCDVAKALEEEGMDFTAHVIGLDVDGKSEVLLECIAQVSGGTYLPAKSAEALKASLDILSNKINTDHAKKKNVRIRASENKKSVEALHKIYKMTQGTLSSEPVAKCYSFEDKACSRYLDIGEYRVKTYYKGMSKESVLNIQNTQAIALHVRLNETTQVEIIAKDKKGGKRLKSQFTLYKMHQGRSDKSATARCSSNLEESCSGRIATGTYLLHSQTDTIETENIIDVVAGKYNSIEVYMGELGRIELSSRAGSSEVKTLHTLYKKGTHQALASCYSDANQPCIKNLPSGEYRVISEYEAVKKENFFELKGSETNRIRMFFSSTEH
jgi:Ca-activated chloride channel family protein